MSPQSTKEKILHATIDAIVKNGIQNVTTRVIAQEAGVNNAALHYYFGTKEQLLEAFLPGLDSINPDFSRDWIRASLMFTERYAQPVPTLNHSRNIPPLETPVPGLWMANMSQVYPWDRGTNYAVELGGKVAALVGEPPKRIEEP